MIELSHASLIIVSVSVHINELLNTRVLSPGCFILSFNDQDNLRYALTVICFSGCIYIQTDSKNRKMHFSGVPEYPKNAFQVNTSVTYGPPYTKEIGALRYQ